MIPLKNDRFIQALLRKPHDRTPVWMMRQAGRYLPEYRALRQQVPNFLKFCKSPELACEATLQPLRRFPFDASIVFSDILTVCDAMGVPLEFREQTGPVISQPIRTAADLKRLRKVDVPNDLHYVLETIDLILKGLDGKVPLIGFAGSPWTLATYMVEGSPSKSFHTIKAMLYQNPKVLMGLLEQLTEVTIDYLNAQIAHGVHAVMIFDTWGGVLSYEAFQQFSLHYLRQIAQCLQRKTNHGIVPLIVFTKGGGPWLELLAQIGCDGLGLDSSVSIIDAKQRVGDRVALQGNLDPFALMANPDFIQQQVQRILQEYGEDFGHIFNLGHGVDKDTPIEHVAAMVEAVQNYGKKSNSSFRLDQVPDLSAPKE